MSNHTLEIIEIMEATIKVSHYWETGQAYGLEQEPIPEGIVVEWVEVIEDEAGDFTALSRSEQEERVWKFLTDRDEMLNDY